MTAVNGDHFVDILEDRRKSSDFVWISRKWSCAPCRYSMERTPNEIKNQVLQSNRVQLVIKELSEENDKPEEEIRELAVGIIDEMSHNFQLKAIRFFGFVLSKLMKQLYQSILVNKKGLEKVISVSSQYPLIFLPTHRSYADFLLVSYICFQFDLPIPVIAAGLDFLGLKTVSTLLRNSGAFFIRRSFIDDRLYWEVFSEYVKTHIQGSEFPIEFFIEGTRSRSAKSLVPKLGMLQVIMEEVFTSRIPDITIIPISISYDRTLEETLYAYELLGVPKPKESTKGLIKARKILSYHFGNVYVRFGDPVSSKDFFHNYRRSVHNLHPRDMSVPMKEEQVLCRDLANHIIRMHQCNLVLSPFPLICLVVGHHSFLNSGVPFDDLVNHVFWLEELVRRTGASVFYGYETLPGAVEYQLKLHSNILQSSPDLLVSSKFCDNEETVSSESIQKLQQTTVKHAVPSMFIYHYSNQALQLLVHMCIICQSLLCSKGDDVSFQDVLFIRYCKLRNLLQREFVFGRLSAEKDFIHALQSLAEEGILSIVDSKVLPADKALHKVQFLGQALLHFLWSYNVICHYLLDTRDEKGQQALARDCQLAIEKAILSRAFCDHKCLSLDIVNNCILFLVSQGALHKAKIAQQTVMVPSHSELIHILQDIETFLSSEKFEHLPMMEMPVVPTAKL